MAEWPEIEGDPEPEQGMLEEFVPAISRAQEELQAIVDWVLAPEHAQIMGDMGLDGAATCVAAGQVAEEAVGFYNLLFQVDRSPLDWRAVQYMFNLGVKIERLCASLPEDIQEHIHEAIALWKVAAAQFPYPQRYAPAVAWAVSGEF